jgi:prevent-host-death family protein
MRSVTVQEAKTHLSRLLREVEDGAQVEIRRGNVPIAVLSPSARGPALAELKERFSGEVEIADDFDAPDHADARDFGLVE